MKITSNPNKVRFAYQKCLRAQKGKRKEKARAELREALSYYIYTRQSGATNRVQPTRDGYTSLTIYAERGCTQE